MLPKKLTLLSLALSFLPLGMSSLAHAEEAITDARSDSKEAVTGESAAVFVEGAGAYGFQLGATPYVPDQDLATYKNPLTSGYAGALSAGVKVAAGLHVTASYEYTSATSRVGTIDGAIDEISAEIDFHTIGLGLRSTRKLGPGSVYAEVGLGVVLPLETKVTYDYVTGAPVPEGTQVTEYNLGYGAQAALGYQLPFGERFFAGTALKLKTLSSSNDGKTTKYTNVIQGTNLVNATVKYESEGVDGMATASPSTYSVQDIRLQLTAGVRF